MVDGAPALRLGRYALYDRIASGGMATVHIGRSVGPVGFSRTVAIKRLHPAFSSEPELVTMLIDEAQLTARVRHANVVQMLDTATVDDEVFIVMEYVAGESLSALTMAATKAAAPIPAAVTSAIVVGVLHGLHAAHEATSARGEPLEIVHRDVSPQNILIGIDGVARLIDFGVAKAMGRVHTTRDGRLKGKLGYMAPEQVLGKVSRRADLYAAGVVLWEALAGRKLFRGDNEGEILQQVMVGLIAPPSKYQPSIGEEVDALVLKALSHDPSNRFESAREMALALEKAIRPALPSEVGGWVEGLAQASLTKRRELIAAMEARPDEEPVSKEALEENPLLLREMAAEDTVADEGLPKALDETSAGSQSAAAGKATAAPVRDAAPAVSAPAGTVFRRVSAPLPTATVDEKLVERGAPVVPAGLHTTQPKGESEPANTMPTDGSIADVTLLSSQPVMGGEPAIAADVPVLGGDEIELDTTAIPVPHVPLRGRFPRAWVFISLMVMGVVVLVWAVKVSVGGNGPDRSSASASAAASEQPMADASAGLSPSDSGRPSDSSAMSDAAPVASATLSSSPGARRLGICDHPKMIEKSTGRTIYKRECLPRQGNHHP